MNLNDQLTDLYEKYWAGLTEQRKNTPNMAHPLLLKIKNEKKYCQSDIKVMIFGQETDGWCKSITENSVEAIMCEYENYFYATHKDKDKKNIKDKNRRPFFNKKNFKFFEKELEKYFTKEKSISFIWNNTSKIGEKKRGRASGEIRGLEEEYFNVIEEEVKILTPDIVIFTCGKSRDKHIEYSFTKDNVEFQHPNIAFGKNKISLEIDSMISKVIFKKHPDIVSLRVDHPNRRGKINDIIIKFLIDHWESVRLMG